MLRVIYDDAATAAGPLFPEGSVAFGDGFHAEEREDSEAFRWMSSHGRITVPPLPAAGFLELGVFSPYYDLSQVLAVEAGGERRELELVHGWAQVSIAVPAGSDAVVLRASKVLPAAHHPGDPRELAVRVRPPRLHADAERHAHVARQQANAVLNVRETLEGRAELRSTPTNLGIDLYGVCNVKPPCVYCDWDFSKDLEGENVDVPFTRETLGEWGELFDNAASLVNCSIGEPFMMKNFDELLDAFGEQGKSLEMATNGQILTDRNIEKLLGRRIHLYVSLDAATADTYAKLRNDKFDRIIANLRRLIPAKGGRAGYPKVHMVFMPMKVNLHELEGFVRLCAELEVDRMVLRPLNYNEATQLDWTRNGHHFKYAEQLLPWDELVRASGRAAELCRLYGVELSDQMDFGGAMEAGFPEEYERGRHEASGAAAASGVAAPAAATVPGLRAEGAATARETGANGSGNGNPARHARPGDGAPAPAASAAPAEPPQSLGEDRLPACLEPWKSLYILRRGILPCCYGSRPLAPMDAYRETWNSETVQGIRRELAAGRFHEYCLSSEACPIVRKSSHAEALTPPERTFLAFKRFWQRADRVAFGVPGKLARPFKGPLAGLARKAAELVS
jgi:sulfatase maturation enzyme AslB (radical SAM superfamily)